MRKGRSSRRTSPAKAQRPRGAWYPAGLTSLSRIQITLGAALDGDRGTASAHIALVGTDHARDVDTTACGHSLAELYVLAAAAGLEALTRQVEVTIILDDLASAELLGGAVIAWWLVPISGLRPELVERLRRAWAPHRDHSAGVRWTDADADYGRDVRRALDRAAALLERPDE